MYRYLMILLMVGLLVVLPAATAAQGGALRVWLAVPDQDDAALIRLAQAVAGPAGLEVSTETVDAALLYDLMLRGGAPPDVIVASNSAAEPLVAAGLVMPLGGRGGFFLQALLDDYPALAEHFCGVQPLERCLWPDAAETIPLAVPQPRLMSQATTGLCDAASWLPFCADGALWMVPLAWDFELFLISADWLAEEGIAAPVTPTEVLNLRREYALTFAQATPERIPTVQAAGFPPVFRLASPLLAEDPEAVMASLASFYAADYVPVLALNLYGVYVSAQAGRPDLATQFAEAAGADAQLKARLTRASGRLPALLPSELLSGDEDIAQQTMQTLALLITYAAAR